MLREVSQNLSGDNVSKTDQREGLSQVRADAAAVEKTQSTSSGIWDRATEIAKRHPTATKLLLAGAGIGMAYLARSTLLPHLFPAEFQGPCSRELYRMTSYNGSETHLSRVLNLTGTCEGSKDHMKYSVSDDSTGASFDGYLYRGPCSVHYGDDLPERVPVHQEGGACEGGKVFGLGTEWMTSSKTNTTFVRYQGYMRWDQYGIKDMFGDKPNKDNPGPYFPGIEVLTDHQYEEGRDGPGVVFRSDGITPVLVGEHIRNHRILGAYIDRFGFPGSSPGGCLDDRHFYGIVSNVGDDDLYSVYPRVFCEGRIDDIPHRGTCLIPQGKDVITDGDIVEAKLCDSELKGCWEGKGKYRAGEVLSNNEIEKVRANFWMMGSFSPLTQDLENWVKEGVKPS